MAHILEKPRAWRRAQRHRQLQRAIRRYVIWGAAGDDLHRLVRHNAEHLAVCSCWMCGHRRRWHGPPPQERRLLQGTDHHAPATHGRYGTHMNDTPALLAG